MELLLKKYFWVVNLAVIAVCAIFAGKAAAHMLVGAYLAGDDVKAPLRRMGALGPVQKTRDKSGEIAVKRNIFCSGCAPQTTVEAADSGPQANEPQKTSLQLDLVSTMVCPADDQWSMAVIRDLSTKEKDPMMYNKGQTITGTSAEILKVLPKRVYLRNGGRLEYVELDGAAPPSSFVAVNVPLAQPAIDPNMGDITDGVNCNGNACTVDRALVEKLLQNTTMLATAARFVPSIKDGKPNGFKLYAIRPQSIFGKIGLQNGDTVKVINGNEMTTPDAALALYTKLRNASHLSVQVERRGETVTLDYTIR